MKSQLSFTLLNEMSNQKESRECVGKRKANSYEIYPTTAKQKRTHEKQLLSLDDHMLLNIFDYLELDTLLSLCRVNRRLRELIQSHRIYRETIELEAGQNGEFDPVILDLLPYTTKLSVILENPNLNKTFEEIATRCGVGNLNEIAITVRTLQTYILSIWNSRRLLEKLQNVTKFTLSKQHFIRKDDPVFARLITKCNLESLALKKMQITKSYLTAMSSLRNLTNLELNYCRVSFSRFSEVMKRMGRQLTSFTLIETLYYGYDDDYTKWNLVKQSMPNLKELCLQTWFCDCESRVSSSNDLVTFTKIQSLTIKVNDSCDCRKLHLFLSRLCSLQTLTKLDFSWRCLFSANGDQNFIADNYKILLGIQDLRLGASFSLLDGNTFKKVLPNLREFTALDKIDFDYHQSKTKFKLILKNGPKLARVTAQIKQLSDEIYQSLVEICKSDRNDKGITIYVLTYNDYSNFLPELKSYDEKYVKIVAKLLDHDDDSFYRRWSSLSSLLSSSSSSLSSSSTSS